MTTNAITVSHLTKQYRQITAVDNISFSVPQGSIFAFLGPNGAGKTTTIKILTTLLMPTQGNIQVCGHDVQKEKDRVRSSFGIVFQDTSVDDELTCYEHMQFQATLYGVQSSIQYKRIKELLTYVHLWEKKDHLVKTFSGGMKRRLEVARGLVHHPKIFFLDEPTVGLDPQTRRNIWEYLKELKKKEHITVFFTTHYMEEVEEVADMIAIIDHGKIIMQGNMQDVLKKTHTAKLEEAFLLLTGKEIREETADAEAQMKMRRQIWKGR